MSGYLQFIVAILVAIITGVSSYLVGRNKNNSDRTIAISNAGDALRDDLMQLFKDCQSKMDSAEKQNLDLHETILLLRLEINALRIENQTLSAELEKTRKELKAFEEKYNLSR